MYFHDVFATYHVLSRSIFKFVAYGMKKSCVGHKINKLLVQSFLPEGTAIEIILFSFSIRIFDILYSVNVL